MPLVLLLFSSEFEQPVLTTKTTERFPWNISDDFSYITDANYISKEEMEKLHGTKYLVINALRKRSHISHYSLSEALEIIKELSPKRAYITHISHQMGLHHDVNEELPQGISLAYDGLRFEV